MNNFFTKLIALLFIVSLPLTQQIQAQCLADAGTTSMAGFPANVCAGQPVTFTTTGAVNVNPPFANSPCVVWGLWVISDPLFVYSGLSGLGSPPSGGPPKDDPNFAKFLGDINGISIGTNVTLQGLGDGATYWVAPITAADCITDPPFIDPVCFDVGDPVQVYFNPEIDLNFSIDCDDINVPTTVVTMQIEGGHGA
ncbi:MAG: hypothetical protein AAF985_27405, partial [Bacteroidota bacterium]